MNEEELKSLPTDGLPIIDGKFPKYKEIFTEEINGIVVKYFKVIQHTLSWAEGRIAWSITDGGMWLACNNLYLARNDAREHLRK